MVIDLDKRAIIVLSQTIVRINGILLHTAVIKREIINVTIPATNINNVGCTVFKGLPPHE